MIPVLLCLFLLAGCTTWSAELSSRDPHAIQVHTEKAQQVDCTSGDDRVSAEIEGDGVIRGLLADATYTCTGGGPDDIVLTMAPLPEGFPVLDPVVSSTPDVAGWHLFTPFSMRAEDEGQSYVAILDAEGRVRWRMPGRDVDGLDASWLGEGKILLGGAEDTNDPPSIVDLDGDVFWTAADTIASEAEQYGAWNHDAGLSADGQSVYALGKEAKLLENGVVCLTPLLKQFSIDDGSLIWSWGTEEGADLPEISGDDPYHANAIWDVEEPGGTKIYMSIRALSLVLKIDRESGAVDWSMGFGGDFTLLETDGTVATEDRWFYGQHDVKVYDSRIYLYDNATYRDEHGGVPATRVLELEVDEEARTVRLLREWRPPDPGAWFTSSMGGVDRTPSGGLSVAAAKASDNTLPSFLAEVGPVEGVPYWRMELPLDWAVYRSDRIAAWP